jgi:hypothetical protein
VIVLLLKFKKSTKKTRSLTPQNDKVVIGDEWTGEDRPTFLCSWCNRTLGKLIDSSGQNPSWYCNHCQISFDPDQENLRKESKLLVPDRDQEPLITSIQHDYSEDVEIHHTPEPRGAFKALQQKRLRITDYKESVG